MIIPIHSGLQVVLSPELLLGWILTLARLLGLMVSSPVFSSPGLPGTAKVALVVPFSLLVSQSLSSPQIALYQDAPALTLGFAVEFGIGWTIGFCFHLLIEAVRMMGDFISLQIGLSAAASLDPTTGQQNPILAQALGHLMLLWFFSLNLHHWLFAGLSYSLDQLPIASWGWSMQGASHLCEKLLLIGTQGLELALLLVFPVLSLMLLLEWGLALISKLMPQMHLFTVALPAKILIGYWALSACLPYSLGVLQGHWLQLAKNIRQLYGT
jgi:flagellar biosynthesis protein FliR